jgi:hypothetical protein
LTEKHKRDGDDHETDFESCQLMLSSISTSHINRNLLNDHHAIGALSQPSPGRMGPPQTPDLAGYHTTLPSAASSVQRPVPTQMFSSSLLSNSFQTFESKLRQISAPPQMFGRLGPGEPPMEYPAWDLDLQDDFMNQFTSSRDASSCYG